MTHTPPQQQPHIIEPGDPASKLLELTHRQFYNFVDQDVRNRLDEAVAAKLRDPGIVERWYTTLIQMKKSVEGQLASAKADTLQKKYDILTRLEHAEGENATALRVALMDVGIKHEKRRAGLIRFRAAVEDAVSEARFLRLQVIEASARTEAALLRLAIARHRDSIDPDDVTDFDLELWRSIL